MERIAERLMRCRAVVGSDLIVAGFWCARDFCIIGGGLRMASRLLC